jgi:hypothetical protein
MKYTNYLLNTEFIDVNSLVSDNKYLKEPSKILPITISIIGIICIGSILPMTIIVDSYNNIKDEKNTTRVKKHR